MSNHGRRSRNRVVLSALLCMLSTGLAIAAVPKEPKAPLDFKAFFRPDLYISSANERVESLLTQLANRSSWEDFLAKRGDVQAFLDPRSGAVTNLMESVPLIPGSGVGNRLRSVGEVDEKAVDAALRAHLKARRDVLGIDLAQLGASRVTKVSTDLWNVSIPQAVGGVMVRDAQLAATISHGNLILLGTETWGNVRQLDVNAAVSADQALEAGFAHADGRSAEDVIVSAPRLEIIPYAPQEFQNGEAFGGSVGQGYGHVLAWTFVFQRPPEVARWEVLVDAHSGEVLAFQDRNSYVRRAIMGGVYPLTNTGVCPNPDQCGVMQSDWPMPFADTGFAAPNNFTNSAGLYNYTLGATATTTLTGTYVNITDTCGAINNSSATGHINLGGANNQHDCTSGGGSAGNTPASRSGFYELNRIAEQARSYLPANAWLNNQLTANMNLNQTCNAFWDGVTVNFFKSGGGCRNTGEIAAVFDHEWGHGLDDNDTGGGLSNPSEAYADIAAIYRLEASCVGHGFFWPSNRGCGNDRGRHRLQRQRGPGRARPTATWTARACGTRTGPSTTPTLPTRR